MKNKSWLKYFFILILILIVVFLGDYVFDNMRRTAQMTYKFNPYTENLLMIAFYGCIGLLLGLEHLIEEIKKVGMWKINIPKLIFITIPSLYFSLDIFLYYNRIEFVRNVLAYPIGILMSNSASITAVFQLILGYSIITSFYKKNCN
jgi:hypothetical protein